MNFRQIVPSMLTILNCMHFLIHIRLEGTICRGLINRSMDDQCFYLGTRIDCGNDIQLGTKQSVSLEYSTRMLS